MSNIIYVLIIWTGGYGLESMTKVAEFRSATECRITLQSWQDAAPENRGKRHYGVCLRAELAK